MHRAGGNVLQHVERVPLGPLFNIHTQHMIEGEQVVETLRLHRLDVIPDGDRIVGNLRLREDESKLHDCGKYSGSYSMSKLRFAYQR